MQMPDLRPYAAECQINKRDGLWRADDDGTGQASVGSKKRAQGWRSVKASGGWAISVESSRHGQLGGWI